MTHDLTVETVKTSGGRRKVFRCSCGWSTMAKTTQTAEKTTRAQHPQVYCPTPDKQRFADREAAAAGLVKFWATSRGKKPLRRAYKCECGSWHTTSQPRERAGESVFTED